MVPRNKRAELVSDIRVGPTAAARGKTSLQIDNYIRKLPPKWL